MWQLIGLDERQSTLGRLEPSTLMERYLDYTDVFEKDISLQDVIELEKIRVLADVAEAIRDFPEYLLDQIGVARNSSNFKSLTASVDDIADAIRETID